MRAIVSTHKIPTDEAIFEEHFKRENIWYWQASANASRSVRLNDTPSRLVDENAGVIFPFITHNDPVGSAAVQRPLAARIVFDFVYDHALSLAVLNSSIDTIIVKTVSQARALAPMIPRANFSLVPPFFSDRFGRLDYAPMASGSLTTASAAVRPYKVEGDYRPTNWTLRSTSQTTCGKSPRPMAFSLAPRRHGGAIFSRNTAPFLRR